MKTLCIGTIALAAVGVTARASASTCSEVSDIVGQEKCTRFGATWSREHDFPLVLETGLVREQFSPAAHGMTARYVHGTAVEHEFGGDDLGPSVGAYGAEFRAFLYVFRGLYIGPDWVLAGGHGTPSPRSVDGYTLTRSSGLNVLAVHCAWVTGIRVPLLDATAFRLEAAVGGQLLLTGYEVSKAGAPPQSVAAASLEPLVDVRALLDFWTMPWTTVSLWGATKPLHPGDFSAGLLIGLHGRPYDGRL